MTVPFPPPALAGRARSSIWGAGPVFEDFEQEMTPAVRAEIARPLAALLTAYREDARLSLFGRLAARWDVRRCLGNLRRLQEEEWRDPAMLAEPVRDPLFISGLPRSGTTFLHRLLAEDACHQALQCWQTVYPYPDPVRDARHDRRAARADFQLRSFAFLSPGFRAVHPLDSRSPQECTEINAHVFQSLRFDSTHHVPSYRSWLGAHGHRAAYRFHRRFLQHVQHQTGGRRWVLKSPDHVFALDALRSVYPDARIIFLHRDPMKVLPSVAQLTEILRRPFSKAVDLAQIGRQVVADWARGAQIMLDESRRNSAAAAQVFHLHYRTLVGDPLGAIERLYAHFGMTLTAASRARMSALIAAEPHGGYGENAYRPERHGIEPDDVRARFADYVSHFGIAQEPDAPQRKAAGPKYVPGFKPGSARHAGS